MIDKIINYNEAKEYVKENGWDSFLKLLQHEYSDCKLYTVSKSWYDNNQYICKARGILGDVVIGWE